jgi:hypothetical protein
MSKRALLRVLTPVSVKTQPKSQIVHAGATAVFRVTAKGTGPFTYVWYFNVSAISGANKSFLTVPKVTELQAGNYRVLINNGVSSTNSDTVTLTVTP